MASQTNTEKTCSKCKITKTTDQFPKNKSTPTGIHYYCKDCCKVLREARKEYNTEYSRSYRAANPEYYTQYRQDNAGKIADYNKRRRPQTNEWSKRRRRENPNYRLRCNLSQLLLSALRRGGVRKTSKTCKLLGASVGIFRQWLEFQFEPWMSWDNYGAWQIDHVLPISRFDLTADAQQHVCFHWSNMRPMCAKANKSKNNSILLHEYFNTLVSAHRFIQKQGLGCREYQALRESLAWLRGKT